MHVSFLNAVIASTTLNSFTVTVLDTGGSSGTSGAYSLGFTATVGTNSLTVVAPTGYDFMALQSLRFRGSSTSGGVFTLTLPVGIDQGVGGETSRNDVNQPVFRIGGDADTLPVVGATVAVNPASAGYNVYQFGALGTSVVRLFSLNF
jgi:hypothetical protein